MSKSYKQDPTDTESTFILPIITIQTDFESVISNVNEGLVSEDKFWISCYKTGEAPVHAKIHVQLDDHDRNLVHLTGSDGVCIETLSGKYTVSCRALHIPPTIIAVPKHSYGDPNPSDKRKLRKITAFDVSPDGLQFATGYQDGSVYTRPTATPESSSQFARSKPHLSTVTSLRFLPSSRVLLTAGLDFTLTILPADLDFPSHDTQPRELIPARTFKGHTRGITSGIPIARGRNIISTAKDGTVRLWDTPSSAQIRVLTTTEYVPVNAACIGARGTGVFASRSNLSADADNADTTTTTTPDVDPREIETADKIVFCALQDGSFEVFDLGTKQTLYRSAKENGMITAISYSSEHALLATGSARGVVAVYDTGALDVPLVSFARNSAAIEDISFLSLPVGDATGICAALGVATADGLPYLVRVRPEGPEIHAELVGPDCDAVGIVRVLPAQDGREKGEVWTACDDGVVRRYVVD